MNAEAMTDEEATMHMLTLARGDAPQALKYRVGWERCFSRRKTVTLFPFFRVDTTYAAQHYEAMLDLTRSYLHDEKDCMAAAADIVKQARLLSVLGAGMIEVTILDDGQRPNVKVRPCDKGGR